jgi:hypothetical protein
LRRERRPSQDGSEYAVVRDTERRELTLQHLLGSQNENEFNQEGERNRQQDAERYGTLPESRPSQDGSGLIPAFVGTERANTSRRLGASVNDRESIYHSEVGPDRVGAIEAHELPQQVQDTDVNAVQNDAGASMSDLVNALTGAPHLLQRQQAAAAPGGRQQAQYVAPAEEYGIPDVRAEDSRGFPVQDTSAYRDRERGHEGADWAPVMSTGRDFGLVATLGNTKFNIAMPIKFNPDTHCWLLWRPHVKSYLEMIGLPNVLSPVDGHRYTLQENRFVIGEPQSIVPDRDSQWISTLQLRFAYQAWQQLEKAYGSRPELDMQRKLVEFDYAKQGDNESTREWAVRLERMVAELNVMAKEAAKENLLGYDAQRDTAVSENTHKFRLLNVRVDGQAHEAFLAHLRTLVYHMSIQEVEKQLVSYKQSKEVQQALSSAAGGTPVWYTHTRARNGLAYGRSGRATVRMPPGDRVPQARECFACGGVRHA